MPVKVNYHWWARPWSWRLILNAPNWLHRIRKGIHSWSRSKWKGMMKGVSNDLPWESEDELVYHHRGQCLVRRNSREQCRRRHPLRRRFRMMNATWPVRVSERRLWWRCSAFSLHWSWRSRWSLRASGGWAATSWSARTASLASCLMSSSACRTAFSGDPSRK